MPLNSVLDEMGFSGYKKKAYLAVLKLGESTVPQISRESGIPTSKLYEVVGNLSTDGYLGLVSRNPYKYVARNPKSVIEGRINDEIRVLENIRRELKSVALKESYEKYFFEIVHGRKAFFKRVEESIANCEKTWIGSFRTFTATSKMHRLERQKASEGIVPRYVGQVNSSNTANVRMRVKNGAMIRSIHTQEQRFAVWDGRVIELTLTSGSKGENYSLWAYNPDLGKALSNYFERLWKDGKEVAF